MNEIKINKMYDAFVIEKYKTEQGKTIILSGSKVFCGCCGKIIALVGHELAFPFNSDDFLEALSEIRFTEEKPFRCVKHDLCNHRMFMFSNIWNFAPIENFIKRQEEYEPHKEKQ